MHMPNFKFLVHFEGKLFEEQSQKMRKTIKKLHTWDKEGVKGAGKSGLPKKHVESLLNAHT